MRSHGRPEAIVTDKLRSYCAELKDIGTGFRRETGCWANNRAENSHLLFRRRERAMLHDTFLSRIPQVDRNAPAGAV